MQEHLSDHAALATPFETWCETYGIHPDDPDAWRLYAHEPTPAAS